jgi:DNA gyrase/topoisomerase IV subunit A
LAGKNKEDEQILLIKEKIKSVEIEDEMKGSYLAYAMSVIVGRLYQM